MKTDRNTKLIAALMCIVLGVMFISLKGNVINVALTVIGIVAIVLAVIDFVHQETTMGVVKAIVGVCILAFGWVFVDAALYIIAAVLLIQGLLELISAVKNRTSVSTVITVISFIRPVSSVVAGVCLFFNKNGTLDWVFILSGILLAVDGILALPDCKK